MRKKLYILLVVLSATALQGCAVEKASVAPKTAGMLAAGKEPAIIACLGDSITAARYHTGNRRAYPEMLKIALQSIYPKATIKIINAGSSGDTTRGALVRIEKHVLRHRPDLVIVMFGMNDMKLVNKTSANPVGTHRVPISEFHNNLVQIIKRCRQIGAEVLLCGQNSINDSPQRTNENLLRYIAEIKSVGEEQDVPVIDFYPVYKEIREKDPLEWMLMMSDNNIHPNMDGHKLFAERIAEAVSGTKVSLADVEPLCPSIPQTLSRLNAGEPVRVLAMPPYDKLIEPALSKAWPDAGINVTTWPVAGKSLPQIEQDAKELGNKDIDLVIIAVPANARADTIEKYIESYSWMLNRLIRNGEDRWDCVAIPPSATQADLSYEQKKKDRIARRIIGTKDIGTVNRKKGDNRAIDVLLAEWLEEQTECAREK